VIDSSLAYGLRLLAETFQRFISHMRANDINNFVDPKHDFFRVLPHVLFQMYDRLKPNANTATSTQRPDRFHEMSNCRE